MNSNTIADSGLKSLALPNGVILNEIPSIKTRCYMAGSDGEIYSCKYKYKAERDNGTVWRPLRGTICPTGYYEVNISVQNKSKTRKSHRLICEAFHGPSPFWRAYCLHSDGDKLNNSPSNLRWGTAKENAADRDWHGTTAKGEKTGTSKLTNQEVALIRLLIKERGSRYRAIGKLFGVGGSAIEVIDKGFGWRSCKTVANVVYKDLPEFELEGESQPPQ